MDDINRPSGYPRYQVNRRRIVVLIVAIVVAAIFVTRRSVDIVIEEEKIILTATFVDKLTIAIDDIEEVSLEENIDIGQEISGTTSFGIKAGKFENELYGKYDLYSYNITKMYIKIVYNGNVVLFNYNSNATTVSTYQRLASLVTK